MNKGKKFKKVKDADLEVTDQAYLFALVDDKVAGHILVSLHREWDKRYGWAMERNFNPGMPTEEAILLNDAFTFVGKQRLLSFLVPSDPSETDRMICRHFFNIPYDKSKHPPSQ